MNKKIACIGEILIDQYNIHNKVENIIAGSSYNTAVSLKKLGNDVYFFGAIGSDDFSNEILLSLKCYKLTNKYVEKVESRTTIAKVILNEQNDRNFEFIIGADQLYSLQENYISDKIDFVHFGSATAFLGGNLEDSYTTLMKYCLGKQIKYSFDPNFRESLINTEKLHNNFVNKSIEFIKKAYIIKLSIEELNIITNAPDLETALDQIYSYNNSAILLITRGSEPTILMWQGKISFIDVPKCEKIVDTTGAGDAFIAAAINEILLIKKINTSNLIKAVLNANKFATLNVQYLGALKFLDFII